MGKEHSEQIGSTELHQLVVKKVLLRMSSPCSRVWSNNTGMGRDMKSDRVIKFGLKGSSDIIGIYKGLFLGIEVKTGRGKQSKHQKNFEEMVCSMGGIYVVIRETNVEQVLDIVEQEWLEIHGNIYHS